MLSIYALSISVRGDAPTRYVLHAPHLQLIIKMNIHIYLFMYIVTIYVYMPTPYVLHAPRTRYTRTERFNM